MTDERSRTLVYVDGFNLYFGCLKRAPQCRWLDVAALAARLCRDQDPRLEVIGVKYFTAPIKAKLSPRGLDSVNAQRDYLLALGSHCPTLEIIRGSYFVVQGSYHPDSHPVRFDEKLHVLRPEEKQTDVNIALHLLADATDGICDHQVLISNDSDCVPALKMVRDRHPAMKIGVVAPILPGASPRRPSRELSEQADWARDVITEIDLEACQLPGRVRTRKRNIWRPPHWI